MYIYIHKWRVNVNVHTHVNVRVYVRVIMRAHPSPLLCIRSDSVRATLVRAKEKGASSFLRHASTFEFVRKCRKVLETRPACRQSPTARRLCVSWQGERALVGCW